MVELLYQQRHTCQKVLQTPLEALQFLSKIAEDFYCELEVTYFFSANFFFSYFLQCKLRGNIVSRS